MQPSTSGGVDAPHPSNSIGSEITSDAKQLGATASDRVHSEADTRKGAAAQQVQSLSSAITQTADGLDESAPPWLKSAFQQGAQKVQQFADTLERKDSREILSDVQTIARDHPGTFLASCAALGFAAARIFKAGEPLEGDESSPAQFPARELDGPLGTTQQATRIDDFVGNFA